MINFFFFSSRRRHTRSDRDWSSDVCSSDLQVERRRGARRSDAAGGGALLDRLAGSLDLAPSGCLEEVDLPDPVHLPRQARELVGQPRPAPLEELAVAIREVRVVLVARFLEEAYDVGLRHVLDALDAEQGGVAAVTLDLLGEPLELLVAVGRVGEQIRPALERHRAQHAQAAPRAHPQARGARREAEQQEEPGVQHMLHTIRMLLPAVNGESRLGLTRYLLMCLVYESHRRCSDEPLRETAAGRSEPPGRPGRRARGRWYRRGPEAGPQDADRALRGAP